MPFNPLIIAAGDLRHAITIQAANPAQRDAAGQPISADWTTVLSTRAKIDSTTGSAYKEAVQDGQLVSQSTWLVTMRYPMPSIVIEPGQRVIFGSDTFLIQSVVDVLKRGRVLRLYCLSIDQESN
jgi:head-tail adaptor